MPRKKPDRIPEPAPLTEIVGSSQAVARATESAATSERVQRAFEALMLASAKELAFQLVNGSPEQKLKISAMLAGPAIKQVLTPQSEQHNQADLEEFHLLRRTMMGADRDDS